MKLKALFGSLIILGDDFMDFSKLLSKIEKETNDKSVSENYAQSLSNASSDFVPVIEAWLNGREIDFDFQGISLSMIQNKENCSYLQSLLRMQLLMSNSTLVKGYIKWTPINKDWRR